MKSKEEIFASIKGGLVVSCQALPEEPLYSPFIMGRMAYAAFLGGAKGIRANTVADIREIKKVVSLPIIGIIKKNYGSCQVFITPTKEEVDALVVEGVEIIAVDATDRERPEGQSLERFFKNIRKSYPQQIFMADCATYEDAVRAEHLGFDCIGSTLAGYTEASKEVSLPAFSLLERMVAEQSLPVIAEGGISTPEELQRIMALGVHAAVVGSAITRPLEITKKFTKMLEQ